MKREIIFIIIVFAGFVLREAWTLRDWQPGYIKPFPFSEQLIKRPTYIWMICCNLLMIGLFYVLLQYSDGARVFFTVALVIQIAELVELFLNYNEPWIRLSGVPVNVTTARYVILFFTGLYCALWKI